MTLNYYPLPKEDDMTGEYERISNEDTVASFK